MSAVDAGCFITVTDGSRVKLQLLPGFGSGCVRCLVFGLESKKVERNKEEDKPTLANKRKLLDCVFDGC